MNNAENMLKSILIRFWPKKIIIKSMRYQKVEQKSDKQKS